MHKKDFIIPFEWQDRKTVVINGLLYIPSYYHDHHQFKERAFFDNSNPIHIEYCSGNGEWIIDRAKKNPTINFIAVEMKFDRARKIWVKMHNENVKNLFIVMGEAYIFSKHYLEDSSIQDVFINFPDPWPKKKHEKNRLISEVFIEEIARIMKKNGSITLVTDDVSYLNQMIESFLKNKDFTPAYEKPYFIKNLQDFGYSYFDNLFRQRNKDINYLKFLRN